MVLPQHHRTSTATRITPSMSVGSGAASQKFSQNKWLYFGSMALNVLLLGILWWLWSSTNTTAQPLQAHPVTFAGGHPTHTQSGTCYCGSQDHYCQCNPSLAIDLILPSGPDHIWVVRRRDTLQYACLGGFVQVGETVEAAAIREWREEMSMVQQQQQQQQQQDPVLQLVGVYSDPRRDNRRHTVSIVYAARLDWEDPMQPAPVAGDDAKEVYRMPLTEIESNNDWFADHKTILLDYLRLVRASRIPEEIISTTPLDFQKSPGDFANDIQRSVCLPLKQ